ncbi:MULTISPECIES: YbaK/EbsC family protein [unclassified Streptomyces]|uniref:YbaK/EbsC family protein n=1 Tax=unclassified Streptomyces TaxID=2593676 RepID=UPI0006AF2425|nr:MULTISPECIES: YbaK/EbsC family protein [unclassified Streptomyces]KOU56692.1 prolyl-tRNA synthetase [Streptomyces sp. IGB124]KOU93829.1 prolyl-tRNA synthetase [Streptomyces sp. XY58]KOV01378.1 prolyl-tRNA synthetase [Streptomyces sp. XY37]KOV27729.1 prolyl-tRNA synthetase [Streptomyces sp. XY413]KOV27992.1 prolyl-tRNA synthetase [Streptomyces sp. H021]
MRAPIGPFDNAVPAPDCLAELVAPVARAVEGWTGDVPAGQILYVDTDPAIADTGAFVAHYGQDLLGRSANCVVVAAKRGGATTLAACLVPSAGRADVNGAVRRHLGARKVSFAPMDTAVELTGMEYGGITPLGLPDGWPVLVDPVVADMPYVLVGSGRRRGKLIAPGTLFAQLPGAELIEGLAL